MYSLLTTRNQLIPEAPIKTFRRRHKSSKRLLCASCDQTSFSAFRIYFLSITDRLKAWKTSHDTWYVPFLYGMPPIHCLFIFSIIIQILQSDWLSYRDSLRNAHFVFLPVESVVYSQRTRENTNTDRRFSQFRKMFWFYCKIMSNLLWSYVCSKNDSFQNLFSAGIGLERRRSFTKCLSVHSERTFPTKCW